MPGVEKLKRELVYFSVLFGKYILPFFRCRGQQIKELTTCKHYVGKYAVHILVNALPAPHTKSSPETRRSSVGARLARDGVRPELPRYRKKLLFVSFVWGRLQLGDRLHSAKSGR